MNRTFPLLAVIATVAFMSHANADDPVSKPSMRLAPNCAQPGLTGRVMAGK